MHENNIVHWRSWRRGMDRDGFTGIFYWTGESCIWVHGTIVWTGGTMGQLRLCWPQRIPIHCVVVCINHHNNIFHNKLAYRQPYSGNYYMFNLSGYKHLSFSWLLLICLDAELLTTWNRLLSLYFKNYRYADEQKLYEHKLLYMATPDFNKVSMEWLAQRYSAQTTFGTSCLINR